MLALIVAAVVTAATGRTLSSHAIDLTNSGRLEDAERDARSALAIADECDDAIGRARALDVLGIIARTRGRLQDAIGLSEEALAIAEREEDRDTLARVENDLGRIAFDLQNDLPLARAWYERALSHVRDATLTARVLNNLGNLARAEHDFTSAIRLYERADKASSDRYAKLAAEHNIGLIYSQQGSPAPALVHLRRALAIELAHRDRAAMARTLLSISESERAMGEPEAALASLEAARRAASDPLTLSTILLRESELHIERNELAAAQRDLDHAIAIVTELHDDASLPQTLTYRARLQLAQGKRAAAIRTAEEAAAGAARFAQLDVRAEALTIAGQAYRRAGRIAEARRAFRAAIDAIEQERSFVVGGEELQQQSFERQVLPYRALLEITPAGEALAVAERAKGRVLFDVFRGSRIDARSVMTPAELARERELRSDPGRYEAFRADLYAAHPELRIRSASPPALDTASLASLLPRGDDAILEYALTGSRLLIFVVTRGGVRTVERTVEREHLRRVVERFAHEIATRNLGFRKTARELHDLLVAPAGAALASARRICIIPDDELWRVPFQALLDRDEHYLIEQSAVFYAPSIAVLQQMKSAPALQFDSLLAVGNPAIPETSREIAALRELYAGAAVTALTDADETRVKSLLPRFRIVHFATHGVFDDRNPLDSHLLFEPSRADDGRLEARELLPMRLQAALIVLSACQTAAGRVAPGEGMIGMSWALFVAGCPAMAASQWKVESESTTAMMIAFHRQLIVNQLTIAESLRNAQLSLLHNSRYEHPFYWASFVALGRCW